MTNYEKILEYKIPLSQNEIALFILYLINDLGLGDKLNIPYPFVTDITTIDEWLESGVIE